MAKRGGARGQARPVRGSNPKAGGKRRAGGAVDDEELEEMMLDDVDRFHKKAEDRIALDGGAEEGSNDDDDDEEGVFDLDVDDDADDDDAFEGDDDEADEDNDEGHGDEGTSLGAKLGKKASAVRGIESGGLLSDEEESSEDEDDARKLAKWGKSKQAYYNADATDLEIGQDFKEAEEEEAAAREVEQARYDELDDEDFGLDDGEDEDKRDGALGTRLKTGGKQERALSGTKGVKGAPGQARSLDVSGDVETTHLPRNLSKLSKAGMLQVLLSEAPELLTLLEEFKEKLSELKDRVEPLVPLARQGVADITDDGVAYLEVKQQLLLSYCINITYYMLLKVEGKSVKDHPVIDHLLELRAALEKMRPLDNKLKYSIDRLLKVADRNAEQDARDPLSFRPDPEALLGKDRVEELDGGAGDDDADAADGVYRAPRLAAVPYDEMESGKKAKQEEKARKNLEKLRRSEIMQSLTEQYSEKPEVVVDRSMSEKERRKLEEADERRRYEEERFVRLATTKKDRKEQKLLQRESTRLETIADIGDFHDLEESLAALNASGTLSGAATGSGVEDKFKKRSATDALQRAVNSLAQREQAKRRKRCEAVGDVDVPFMNRDALEASRSSVGVDELLDEPRPKKSKKPRGEPVEEQPMDFDDLEVEDDPLYDAVAARKAKKRAEKDALYAVEPTYTPMEDELGDAMKRGIDSSILKNRGLTPYKSKLNRNPRVKKREAYRKAVIRRKGQVRDVRDSEGGFYGGETTGINAKVVRTRQPGR